MEKPFPFSSRKVDMDSKQFNEERHNRKLQLYRFALGMQQFWSHPILNIVWLLVLCGMAVMKRIMDKWSVGIDTNSILADIYSVSMTIIFIIIPMLCIIGMIQFVGFCFAIKDEADMEHVFGDKRDVKNQSPILISKKKDRKSGVIKREFYTTIPMERWQEKKEAICDRMDVHLIGDISYGGRKKNKGNHIYFESAKGRNPKERGVLYDDTF
mgnify:CR=1 FL=1